MVDKWLHANAEGWLAHQRYWPRVARGAFSLEKAPVSFGTRLMNVIYRITYPNGKIDVGQNPVTEE
jgi:hypothetical protein